MKKTRSSNSIAEKRAVAEGFLQYLKERGLIKTWHRPDLALYYHCYAKTVRESGVKCISFSTALYVLARTGKREVVVRRGQTIIFRGTADFQNRSTATARMIESSCVKIKAISEQTTEWRPGHITRKLSDMSREFSFIELELKNDSGNSVELAQCKLLTRSKDFRLEYSKFAMIEPASKLRISIQAIEEVQVCTTEVEIMLMSKNGAHETTENLIRYLKFEVVGEAGLSSSDETEDPNISSSPSSGVKGYVSFADFVPGVKPDTLYLNKLKMVWPLPPCFIPRELKLALQKGVLGMKTAVDSGSDAVLRNALKRDLEFSNYKSKFSLLLQIEEWQNQEDIKRYDMRGATLTERRGQKLLYLRVPGLAEKRPSVLRGDKVYVKPLDASGQVDNECYQGYVHRVELEEVGLGFDQRIWTKHVKNKKYYVRFDFNRLALRLMHRSITSLPTRSDAVSLLFPTTLPQCREVQALKMYNRDIDDNLQQREAVENIVGGGTSSVYVIYGPPGTGKTVTMVEAIHQTLRLQSRSHMLVCAPSNSACDLLTARLLKHIDKREILRIHAASRNWSEVPGDVKDVSNYDSGEFCYPAKEELMKCRVVVTTLITAGRIASASFPKDHFNWVFVDEVGQAMEPELMIAVAGVLSSNDGKLVLAGDPKQLGPVIRSPVANSNGLAVSFLERLMTCSAYKKNASKVYNRQCLVKLLNNYRSHESIIHVSNKEFYDGELRVCADEAQRNFLCDWEGLPKINFPVIFHGIQGEDKRDLNNPSFYNPQEVQRVKLYVSQLLDIKGRKVCARDIGVITPYRKQVLKIRGELKDDAIKVGCVEEFQGQERRVIIVSTVRSNTQHLQTDVTFNLGFLRNPKRFNVAVTRAKALMIIVGNPHILCLEPYWRSLLMYCLENGGYTGIKFDQTTLKASDESLEEKFKQMTVSLETNGVGAEDQPNPRWRQDQ